MASKHKKDVERLLFERQFGTDQHVRENNDDQVGEITGAKLDGNEIRGLPIRSEFNIKKQLHDDNSHVDFDLARGKIHMRVRQPDQANMQIFIVAW